MEEHRGAERMKNMHRKIKKDIKSKGYFCSCAEETCYFTENEMRERRKKG